MANPYAATVLVADDDVDALGVVAFGLERMGYRVLRAHDGEEALKLVLERRPDLAILDVMMPKVNGYDLVRQIRATDEVAETPLILLTARAGEFDRRFGFEVGADEYVRKPFSPKELEERVDELLARSVR
jgi:DNA-binding response OmpR family regulator